MILAVFDNAARASVDALLGHDFDQLVVGYGMPSGSDARDALVDAYRFLG